jgi:Holliday junction DNA helicase RuvB
MSNRLYSLLAGLVEYFVPSSNRQVDVPKSRNVNKVSAKMQSKFAPTENMRQMDFRPKNFDEVIGQQEIKEFLKLKIIAFRKTRNSLVHILFLGYSGLGKTTLANVVANEMGVGFHQIMATRIRTWADFYNIIKNVEENDVVFIDEIHALAPKIQEHLYGVMEDFTCTVDDKNLNRQVKMQIPRFTLIGATTHTGDLNAPFLSRFQHKAYLLPYSVEDLTKMIISAGERIYNITIPNDVANKIARLSRKTARIAYNLLRSYMDLAEATTVGRVSVQDLTMKLLYQTLRYEKIDPIIGLDIVSRSYIVALLKQKKPVGFETLANLTKEQPSTVKSMIEPFLLSDIELTYVENAEEKVIVSNFVSITREGRVALPPAFTYIKLCQTLQEKGWFKDESLNIKSE